MADGGQCHPYSIGQWAAFQISLCEELEDEEPRRLGEDLELLGDVVEGAGAVSFLDGSGLADSG